MRMYQAIQQGDLEGYIAQRLAESAERDRLERELWARHRQRLMGSQMPLLPTPANPKARLRLVWTNPLTPNHATGNSA